VIALAFDPGLTTGLAILNSRDKAFMSWQLPCWEAVAAIEGLLVTGMLRTEKGWAEEYTPKIVAGEDYTITSKTLKMSRQYEALESIGAIRYLCMRSEVEYMLRPPSEAAVFSTDSKLKAIGWYNPTKGGHANSAARVLLLIAAERGLVDRSTLLVD
jgi:hypothetical protein